MTSLIRAAEWGRDSIVKTLICHGANVNMKDKVTILMDMIPK